MATVPERHRRTDERTDGQLTIVIARNMHNAHDASRGKDYKQDTNCL